MFIKNPRHLVLALGILIGILAGVMVQQQTKQTSNSGTNSVLAPSLKMGVTELNVRNMQSMRQYYRDSVGLDILKETTESVTFGYRDREILRLLKTEFDFASQNSAGLYHTAIVFSSRGELAASVQRLLTEAPQTFQGTADHLVSEAFYFGDPEGNGLELYFDKDPSTWKWENNRVQMGSKYIDPNTYIAEHIANKGDKEKHMGHVHLKVGDIEEAKKFYVDTLGFDITQEMPTALFISVGGYHHHFGLNIWESYGAGKRNDTLGLKSVELVLPNITYINNLKQRLQDNGIVFKEENGTLFIPDPWNNLLIIRG